MSNNKLYEMKKALDALDCAFTDFTNALSIYKVAWDKLNNALHKMQETVITNEAGE